MVHCERNFCAHQETKTSEWLLPRGTPRHACDHLRVFLVPEHGCHVQWGSACDAGAFVSVVAYSAGSSCPNIFGDGCAPVAPPHLPPSGPAIPFSAPLCIEGAGWDPPWHCHSPEWCPACPAPPVAAGERPEPGSGRGDSCSSLRLAGASCPPVHSPHFQCPLAAMGRGSSVASVSLPQVCLLSSASLPLFRAALGLEMGTVVWPFCVWGGTDPWLQDPQGLSPGWAVMPSQQYVLPPVPPTHPSRFTERPLSPTLLVSRQPRRDLWPLMSCGTCFPAAFRARTVLVVSRPSELLPARQPPGCVLCGLRPVSSPALTCASVSPQL